MRSFLYFIFLVVLLGSLLLAVNLLLAPHVPYKEKKTPFECGYHSFNQTRFPIEIKPLIFALMFVIFDVELVSAFPYVVSSVANERFGFAIFIVFVVVLCVGFIFELGKGALTIESRQSKDILADIYPGDKYINNCVPVKATPFDSVIDIIQNGTINNPYLHSLFECPYRGQTISQLNDGFHALRDYSWIFEVRLINGAVQIVEIYIPPAGSWHAVYANMGHLLDHLTAHGLIKLDMTHLGCEEPAKLISNWYSKGITELSLKTITLTSDANNDFIDSLKEIDPDQNGFEKTPFIHDADQCKFANIKTIRCLQRGYHISKDGKWGFAVFSKTVGFRGVGFLWVKKGSEQKKHVGKILEHLRSHGMTHIFRDQVKNTDIEKIMGSTWEVGITKKALGKKFIDQFKK